MDTHLLRRRSINIQQLFYQLIILFLPMHLFSQGYSYGTAIIIERTKDSIFIAADSQIRGNNPNDILKVCKIKFVNGIGIAVAGLYKETISGFDPTNIAIRAAQIEGTIDHKIQFLEDSIQKPIIKAWNNIIDLYSPTDINVFHSEIAFCSFKDDIPIIIFWKFYPKIKSSKVDEVEIVRHTIPDPKMGEGPNYLLCLGQSREITQEIIKNADKFSGDHIQMLNQMIQRAIDIGLDVGPPINILLITKDGKKWIQRNQECSELE